MGSRIDHADEAARVYAITVALLHNEPIHNIGLTIPPYVKEVATHRFHIWHQQPDLNGQSTAPVAVCTYNKLAHNWAIELNTGETLTLVDNGNIWDIVEEEKPPKGKAKKRVGRPRTPKGGRKRR